ncbi:MAG TPA: amino acid adenylation domain-containing protein, partial [Gammaproteobacteria bacterium]|nr:amino acid adenylation domain-containing protein [Gammaproteobacteria bacterium]
MNSAQEELLALLLEEQGIDTEQAPPLTPRARNTPPPLSFAQQRLWFLEQWEQGSAAYNICDAARLSGVLKVDILERALSEIVRRHEVLRTTFKSIEGTPVQVIHPATPLNLPLIDLRLLPRPQREAEVLRMAGEAARQLFNLDQGPLLRVTLLRVDEHEHVLLLTIHHIIFDIWSRKVFRRELHTLYEAYLQGRAAPLAELPIQYADYAYWQREWLQSGLQAQQMAYWKERLGGALPVLELPADYPRPAQQTFNGALVSRVLPDALSQALLHLGQREGATLFMTLLAAFKALLHRYTGQHDIIVGTPIANRSRIETEGLIGFFLNTLALRTDVSGDPSFTELLIRVREQALQAYDHQDLPFERLVEELQPTRDPSHSPLFQVMFVLQNDVQQSVGLPGVTFTPLEVDNHTAKFDLTVFVIESGRRLTTHFEYNTDLFSEQTVAPWLDHWQTLLEGIVADPAQRLSELPLLSAPERHRLLVEWNPWPPFPTEQTLAGLFEAQVERTPHAIAVAFEDRVLSYDELNGRANQLAHRLRALGVGPEVLVGLCMERSLELVVGLLGILKAGGAYVPLDPGYPKERLAFLLEDTGVRVLVAQQRLVAQLPAHRARVLCLPSAALEEESRANPVSGVRPDHLAYVMYTSGSTGTPKGVAVPQRAVARLVTHTDYVTLGPEQVFLQFAPLAFDASTFELWGALLNGGKLVVFPPHTPTLAELGTTLQARRITTLWLTAGLFHAMVDEQLWAFQGVRQLLAGGDVLSVPHVQRFLAAHPGCRLINGYGPTENTTFSCCYTIPPHAALGRAVPIGRPIAHTQAYILDAYCHPVPIGVFGELYLGGAGLARGYHNRPELTAEKFIPHPFSPDPSARLYKTGDLARYLPDGNIEFLGRTDHQVKIRGFRIELGEIEAVLSAHPSIKEAVVIAREDTPGDKRLVAYLAASPAPSSQELRNYLMARLPEYMLPAIFVILDALPLTPNGKLDRKALPAPGATQAGPSYTAPRDNLELQLSKIWERLLRVPAVGIHDNFFELGGHSLLAVRLVAQIEKIWGKNVPLATLFQA